MNHKINTIKVEFILRHANYSDLDEILLLFTETIKHTCNKDYDQRQIEAWTSSARHKEKWKEYIRVQSFFVATTKDEIVGFGSLQNGNQIHLLYVHHTFLRCQIGTLLYKRLKNVSHEMGFENMTADVSITARPFFESKGFILVRENKKMINGTEIINYRMSQ